MKRKVKNDVDEQIKDEDFRKGGKDGVKDIQNEDRKVGKAIDKEEKKVRKKKQ
jgi:hypothetical protein